MINVRYLRKYWLRYLRIDTVRYLTKYWLRYLRKYWLRYLRIDTRYLRRYLRN